MTIRPAALEDAAALTGLINRAFVVEQFFVDGERIAVEGVLERFRSGVFLIDEENGVPAGCVFAERRSTSRGYIGLLAVEPPLKGRGIGTRLMTAAEEWCTSSGCAEVDITVVSVRTELFPFYEALGYRSRAEEPFTDRPTKVPCHFVIMTKPLVPAS